MSDIKVVSTRQFASLIGRLAAKGGVIHTVVEKRTNIDVIVVTECPSCVSHTIWVAHNKGVDAKDTMALDRAIGTWQVSNGWELYTVS